MAGKCLCPETTSRQQNVIILVSWRRQTFRQAVNFCLIKSINALRMDRLTLNRRQKTTGDKIDCIPAGYGLPVWSTLSLDAKLPMMSSPKGSVLLYTTKLGEPVNIIFSFKTYTD